MKIKLQSGFTLIELMIIVAIVGILASIALPAYTDYVKRGKAQEAPAELSKMRNRIEQYYQDKHSYANLITDGICTPTDPKNFAYDCGVPTSDTYTLTATGNASEGMSAFQYTIDQDGAKTSIYFGSASLPCWQTKKGGGC